MPHQNHKPQNQKPKASEVRDRSTYYKNRASEIKSDAYQREVDAEYRRRQRLMAEEERKEQEYAVMKIESDRRYKDAMAHASDSWWQHRSEAYDRELELKCGHQIGLR